MLGKSLYDLSMVLGLCCVFDQSESLEATGVKGEGDDSTYRCPCVHVFVFPLSCLSTVSRTRTAKTHEAPNRLADCVGILGFCLVAAWFGNL